MECILSPDMPPARQISRDAIRFGAIIHRLRMERGWTLVKFAQRSGMHLNYVSILERGGNVPSLVTILELADVFGVDPGDMVREVADARKPKPVAPPE